MEETVILEFKVDQAEAQKQLEKTEKALLDLKEEQKELSKAYKEGTISQDKYVKENLRLQNSIKKENDQKRTLVKTLGAEDNSRNALRLQISKLVKEYDNLNTATEEGARSAQKLEKEISDLTGKLTNGDKAAGLFKNQIGNYPEQFAKAAESVEVAGVSVGSITSRLAAFANPATAAVGILTALGGAYARSTIGAKDLEFAQNQLGSAITLATNAFAAQISSAEDGEGVFSRLTNRLIAFFGGAETAALTKAAASTLEDLQDLEREELKIRAQISDRLEENQELLTLISNEETDINEKLNATAAINANLVNNQSDLVDVKQRELELVQFLLRLDEENDALKDREAQLEAEINKTKSDTTKKIQANIRLQDDLNAKLREQIALERGANRRAQTSDDAAILTGQGQSPQDVVTLQPTESAADNAEKFQQGHADRMLKINRDFYQRDAEFKEKYAKEKARIEEENLRNTTAILGQTASLFEEGTAAFKVLASGQIIANTYSAATAALAPPPLGAGPIFGPAFAAVAIATGLANLARVNEIEFAEGGYTGQGAKYDVAGVVHKGEYVAPKHIVESRQAAPHIAALEGMRMRGYADGGFVANQNTQPAQQALIMANALKNLPPVIASWTEGRAIGRRLEFRENLSKLG